MLSMPNTCGRPATTTNMVGSSSVLFSCAPRDSDRGIGRVLDRSRGRSVMGRLSGERGVTRCAVGRGTVHVRGSRATNDADESVGQALRNGRPQGRDATVEA